MSSLPILIVGAGPTGMTAALELARFGLRSIIFDADNKLADGSRAIAIHRTALEVFERIGAVEPMLDKGIAWQIRRTYFRDQELFVQHMPDPGDGVLPTFVNLQQYYTELYLYQRIQETDLITLNWEHRIVDVRQDDTTSTLVIDTPDGRIEVEGSYILACDGARSTLRKLLQLEFPGDSHADHFLIADIRGDMPFEPQPRFFFDPPSNPGRTILIHPQPDNVWRMDWQLGEDVDIEAECLPENMDKRIRALIGDTPYEMVWLSHYRFHQRLLDQFRHGRIFFLGDSAHLMAPFGARGMNSSIQDVENLMWKLWLVLSGRATDDLLDTYDTERWPAQLENQDVTDTTMQFMVPRTEVHRAMRDTILRLSGSMRSTRRWVDSGKMSKPFTYKKSPILCSDKDWNWGDGMKVGAKVLDPTCHILQGDTVQKTRLRHACSKGFTLLYFAHELNAIRKMVKAIAKVAPFVPIKLCIVTPNASLARGTRARIQDNIGITWLVDQSGELHEAYNAQTGTGYLIRPDRHLAARRQQLDPAHVTELVSQASFANIPAEAPAPRTNNILARLVTALF